jgi:hypothetical protein
MQNIPNKRYYSNLIGLGFLFISFISTMFIQEKLIRTEKDNCNSIENDIDIDNYNRYSIVKSNKNIQ